MGSPPVRRAGPRAATLLLLPLFALVVVSPLLWRGPSCGHDFGFHMQSWMDAGTQLRHGDLLPRWADSPAFNAGEPRFIFYPPLSWLLGSLLLLLLPAPLVPAAFTWLALTAAALGMFALCRRFAGPAQALLGAAAYLANPYLLFTAFERTAYAELLAAAWMPLLFRAALAPQVRAVSVAVPLALLWLTNAPAAVMGTYALLLLLALRWLLPSGQARRPLRLLLPGLSGLLLGLGLAGFYLVPAALERRYVQIAMAIIPNMRVEDNFLFGHTGYGPHDVVLHTASLVALATMGLTALLLLLAWWPGWLPPWRRSRSLPAPDELARGRERSPLVPLAFVALVVALLLWHVTLPVWHLLPELAFLQFPWRLLCVMGPVLGLAGALALRQMRFSVLSALVPGLLLVAGGTALAIRPFRQGCTVEELPAARVARFNSHHGVGPTDEYTPVDADNDQLRWDDPGWWLASSLNAPGPGTVPNPAATIEDYDQPPPLEQTVAGFAPRHLVLHLPQPAELVLNLRDYPAWAVTVNGNPHPERLGRDDGLLALQLPAGRDEIDIRWHTLPDVWAGMALSLLSLLGVGLLRWRSRRMGV